MSGEGDEGNREEITEEITEVNDPPPPPTRTSSRIKVPTQAFLDSVAQENLDFHDFRRDTYIPQTCAFESTYLESPPAYYEALHQEDFTLQDQLSDQIAFLTQTDGDTIHFGQTMKAHDRKNFKVAMQKEFTAHCERIHWEIIPVEEVPQGEKVLDSV